MNKLQTILEFALQNGGSFTSKDANELVGHTYYCNGPRHVCAMLSRAVKSGKIERVKKGGFRVKAVPSTGRAYIQHPDQCTLELDPPKPKFPHIPGLSKYRHGQN